MLLLFLRFLYWGIKQSLFFVFWFLFYTVVPLICIAGFIMMDVAELGIRVVLGKKPW